MAAWQIDLLSSADDIDAILAIEHSSFTNPWTREMYQAELENRGVSLCFMARDDAGRIVDANDRIERLSLDFIQSRESHTCVPHNILTSCYGG